MPRCPKCKKSFKTLEDEQDMHECPRCGWAPWLDDKEPEEPEPVVQPAITITYNQDTGEVADVTMSDHLSRECDLLQADVLGDAIDVLREMKDRALKKFRGEG